jgi:hypothetical protein
VNDQRGQAQCARGQWMEILFLPFPNFSKEYNTSPPDFHLKYKKGKNQPTLAESSH